MPITQGPVPAQSEIFTVLRAFLLDVLGPNVEVIQAQDNRVPEPAVPDFVTMTVMRRDRLRTNVDTAIDAKLVGSIAGTVMTITGVVSGSVAVGDQVFGVNVVRPTTVVALGSGVGGTGTYTIAPAQTIASQTLSTGTKAVEQGTEVVVQLDVHGPNSHDNAQIISTLTRDEYATTFFSGVDPTIAPLHADDPIQVPFVNDQDQWETRYVVTALLQANQVVTVPQEFADVVTVGLIPADIFYPP